LIEPSLSILAGSYFVGFPERNFTQDALCSGAPALWRLLCSTSFATFGRSATPEPSARQLSSSRMRPGDWTLKFLGPAPLIAMTFEFIDHGSCDCHPLFISQAGR
jgi:hypothetical protein